MDDRDQFDAIFSVVRTIPAGYVMSYGQVGAEAGGISPRIVGWAMANANQGVDVPWHRVVGAQGVLSIGKRSPQLEEVQHRLLERECVIFLENGHVDMRRHQVGVAKPSEPSEAQKAMAFDDGD